MVSSRSARPCRKFSARAVSVNGKGSDRAASTAAATRSVARPMSNICAPACPGESSIDPPTSPTAAAARMARAVSAGASPKPFSRSAETGRSVAAQMIFDCAMDSSIETLPSRRPSVPADAPLDVASAGNPSEARMRAVPPSQQLAMRNVPDACRSRKRVARSSCAGSFMRASGKEVASLARSGRDVIHDFLERRYPDFRMLAQVFDELSMRVRGDLQVVSARAVKLEDAESAGHAYPLDVGDERGPIGAVHRSIARHLERIEPGDIRDHGRILITPGPHEPDEPRFAQRLGVVDAADLHLAAGNRVRARTFPVDTEQQAVHDADLAEHARDIVVFREVLLAVRQHRARTRMVDRVVAELVAGALHRAPAQHVVRGDVAVEEESTSKACAGELRYGDVEL